MRHEFIMWLIVAVFVFAAFSYLFTSAQQENPNINATNVTDLNFTAGGGSPGDATDMIGGILGLWGDMLGVFPVWLQLIIATMLSALVLYVLATIFAGVGG